jgi:hypothetical protein
MYASNGNLTPLTGQPDVTVTNGTEETGFYRAEMSALGEIAARSAPALTSD